MEKSSINILISEDQKLLAKLLLTNLASEPEFSVVGFAQDGKTTIELEKKLSPDVLLLDVNLPDIDGMQVLKQIREDGRTVKVVVVSNMCEGWLVKKAVTLGANAYISKDSEYEEIKKAIHSVTSGETYFCKNSFSKFLDNVAKGHSGGAPHKKHQSAIISDEADDEVSRFRINMQNLTERELEILQLIVEEKTSKEISDILYISPRTVETHRKNILQKLGIKNSMKIIKLAAEAGITELGAAS